MLRRIRTEWSSKVGFLKNYWTKEGIPEYRHKMIDYIVAEIDHYREKYNISIDNIGLIDAGCGNGLLYEYLPDEYKICYFGFDFTPEMIEHCREYYPANRFTQADILNQFEVSEALEESRELRDNTLFEIIVTQNVIQHVTLWMFALNNLFIDEPSTIINCERTQDANVSGKIIETNSVVAGYNPTRWRFRQNDFLECLDYLGTRWISEGEYEHAEMLYHPLTTQKQENMLTIFRIRKKE